MILSFEALSTDAADHRVVQSSRSVWLYDHRVVQNSHSVWHFDHRHCIRPDPPGDLQQAVSPDCQTEGTFHLFDTILLVKDLFFYLQYSVYVFDSLLKTSSGQTL